MGKVSKWLRRLLTGRKEKKTKKKETGGEDAPASKEKRRWSFRRSVGASKELSSPEPTVRSQCHGVFEPEIDQKRHAVAVAVATAAAADAAMAAAQAAAAVVRLTAVGNGGRAVRAAEEAAAIRIQSVFRSYLAKKALCALKGLVKLQALVRGHLVRKQATATLRCMQALVNAQVRARAKRIGLSEESHAVSHRQNYRRSPQHSRFRQSFDATMNEEEFIKIVEIDRGYMKGDSKNIITFSKAPQTESIDHRHSTYNSTACTPPSNPDIPPLFSPAPSALTETNPMSPTAFSGHYEDFSFATAQGSPHLSAISMPPANAPFDYHLHPNYMANTESSRAKVRSQSAPRPRLDTYERQSSKRRPSVEGRSIPRGSRMQRSSSHVGLTSANSYQYPWFFKLDKSNMSLKGSECGSSSTVMTNSNYCRSVVGYELRTNA